ncbi:MAG: hypothetical protein UV38_C0003G0100 [candidate division TM6 bacterium GW2011_GWE2_42_60]|nr:MAG: hypothetical protein UV38_C0003G0100 [candidate division TM6 bacterium GW2011_GWE2_42_60]HBY05420.1 hypothetical protein [Candidatus Dependentiae bacterium]
MKRRSCTRAQGFTLIEIAGALLLFALMAMPIISMQFSMLKSVARSYTSVCAILALRAYPVELERDGKFVFEKKEVKPLRFESETELPPFKRTAEIVQFKDQSIGKSFTSARIVRLDAKPDELLQGQVFQMTTFIAVPPPPESKAAPSAEKNASQTKNQTGAKSSGVKTTGTSSGKTHS